MMTKAMIVGLFMIQSPKLVRRDDHICSVFVELKRKTQALQGVIDRFDGLRFMSAEIGACLLQLGFSGLQRSNRLANLRVTLGITRLSCFLGRMIFPLRERGWNKKGRACQNNYA